MQISIWIISVNNYWLVINIINKDAISILIYSMKIVIYNKLYVWLYLQTLNIINILVKISNEFSIIELIFKYSKWLIEYWDTH